ncbi:MAG: DUF3137 domain-containing protein [Alphaproteobacteria bacterium]|nr:DUF3137 domain-containing protein [Alphaproteobacteria bacterium]
MTTVADIPQAHDTYAQETQRLAQAAENLRLRHVRRLRTRHNIAITFSLLVAIASAGGFGWYLMMEGDLPRALACTALAAVVPPLLLAWAARPLADYRRAHKQKFMPQLARLLGGLTYRAQSGLNPSIIKAADIAPAFTRHDSEDCFTGTLNGVKVIFSEMRLFDDQHVSPRFSGLCVLLESALDQRFSGHVVITDDPAYEPSLPAREFSFESPETTQFSLYAETPEAAQAVANPRLLKELAEAAARFKAPVRASFFKGRYVLIMFTSHEDMFEPSDLLIPVRTANYGTRVRTEISRILEIIDVVGLYS